MFHLNYLWLSFVNCFLCYDICFHYKKVTFSKFVQCSLRELKLYCFLQSNPPNFLSPTYFIYFVIITFILDSDYFIIEEKIFYLLSVHKYFLSGLLSRLTINYFLYLYNSFPHLNCTYLFQIYSGSFFFLFFNYSFQGI